MQASRSTQDLEHQLTAVEARLTALGEALRDRNPAAIDREAAELHQCLAATVQIFGVAARAGGVPVSLRQRLAAAGGQVAAQREALARATASLDRAIDILLPATAAGIYSAAGVSDRPASQGTLHA